MKTANSNAESRADADSEELQAAQAAAEGVAYFLDVLIAKGYESKGLAERMAKFVKGFNDGTATVKAEFVFDSDGVVSIAFYQLKGGRPPKLIFDCVPTRKLDS